MRSTVAAEVQMPLEDLPALLLGDDPMIASGLHPPSECSVSRRDQHPAFRDGHDIAIGGSDGVRGRAGGEGVVMI